MKNFKRTVINIFTKIRISGTDIAKEIFTYAPRGSINGDICSERQFGKYYKKPLRCAYPLT